MSPANKVLARIAGVGALYAAYTLAIATLPPSRPGAPIDPDRYAAGLEVWLANRCQTCHSIYGLGGHTGPDLTNVMARPGAAEYVHATLRHGRGLMPAFDLSDAETGALIDYLRTIDATGRYPPTSITDDVFGGTR